APGARRARHVAPHWRARPPRPLWGPPGSFRLLSHRLVCATLRAHAGECLHSADGGVTMSTAQNLEPTVESSPASNRTGYRSFQLGSFNFSRDEYFVHVSWPAKGQTLTHTLSADAFLRAMMRDVAWGFFYGWVNLDAVIGTRNLYGKVEMYAGRYHPSFHEKGLDLTETFETPQIMATFKAILDDWTNSGFDPFAAPDETGKDRKS